MRFSPFRLRNIVTNVTWFMANLKHLGWVQDDISIATLESNRSNSNRACENFKVNYDTFEGIFFGRLKSNKMEWHFYWMSTIAMSQYLETLRNNCLSVCSRKLLFSSDSNQSETFFHLNNYSFDIVCSVLVYVACVCLSWAPNDMFIKRTIRSPSLTAKWTFGLSWWQYFSLIWNLPILLFINA